MKLSLKKPSIKKSGMKAGRYRIDVSRIRFGNRKIVSARIGNRKPAVEKLKEKFGIKKK